MSQEFEWDPSKDKKNLAKHGVPFEYATCVFDDPQRVDRHDARCDYGEERRLVTGHIDLRLFVVAYTERDDVIRLISARKANAREQEDHYGAIQARPK
jgi:uncharacterized DUF497 family protein